MYDDVRTTQYKPSHTQYNCVLGVFLSGPTQVRGITMSCLTKNPLFKEYMHRVIYNTTYAFLIEFITDHYKQIILLIG